MENSLDGRIKLFVTHRLLAFRRDHPELFASGDYQPLEVAGAAAAHVCAFSRQLAAGARGIVVVVPRLIAGLLAGNQSPPLGEAVWGDTTITLPEQLRLSPLRNVLTGDVVQAWDVAGGYAVPVADVLASFPVAVLAYQSEGKQSEG